MPFKFNPFTGTLDATELADLSTKQNTINAFDGAILTQVSGAGDIQGVSDWQVNSDGGLTQTIPKEASNLNGSTSINYWQMRVDNAVSSPDESFLLHYNRMQLDETETGLGLGTNGQAARFIYNDLLSTTDADVGEIAFITNAFDIGETGGSAIESNGFSYARGSGTIRDNVTVIDSIQGYGFQPTFENGSSIDTGSFLNAFYDFTNAANTTFSSYSSVNLSPVLGGILTGQSLIGVNISPTVTEFFGNASSTGINVTGDLGDFGTGNYNGIVVSTDIDDVDFATGINIFPSIDGVNVVGLQVDMSNSTGSTTLTAANFTGNVTITGALNLNGNASTSGNFNISDSTTFTDNGGTPQVIHGFNSTITAIDSSTTTNADTIGVSNTASMIFEEDSVTSSGAFNVGACAHVSTVLPKTETNATMDYVRSAVFAISMDSTSTGGTVSNAIGVRSAAIPNANTTVSKYIAFQSDLPFGDLTTDDSFGFFCEADIYNYFAGHLCIGSSQEKTSNKSVALEIASTTKAFLNAVMTTTQRDALTAINGMQIYNTTTSKLQVYAGGSWTDLH